MSAQAIETLVVCAAVLALGVVLLAGREIRGIPAWMLRHRTLSGIVMVALSLSLAVAELS